MGNSYFQFKQFRIDQGSCSMKISTDAVVLGALSGNKIPATVLDIGTGTGVIALMLAQRNPEAHITGLEIDSQACTQATENVQKSPWPGRIDIVGLSLQKYQDWGKKVDLIVSNPPYFPNHLRTEDSRKNQALHQDSLTFEELLNGVRSLLNEDGEFWIILPERQMTGFTKLARTQGFEIITSIAIRDSPGKPVLRVIQGFGLNRGEIEKTVTEELLIKDDRGNYSAHYRQVLKDFMLHF